MTGEWPALEIDHINLDPADNRFCNLREATKAQNKRNTRKYCNNTSGTKGVFRMRYPNGRFKWRAQIGFNGNIKYLGSFDTIEEAAAVYTIAAKERFGEFARLSRP